MTKTFEKGSIISTAHWNVTGHHQGGLYRVVEEFSPNGGFGDASTCWFN